MWINLHRTGTGYCDYKHLKEKITADVTNEKGSGRLLLKKIFLSTFIAGFFYLK